MQFSIYKGEDGLRTKPAVLFTPEDTKAPDAWKTCRASLADQLAAASSNKELEESFRKEHKVPADIELRRLDLAPAFTDKQLGDDVDEGETLTSTSPVVSATYISPEASKEGLEYRDLIESFHAATEGKYSMGYRVKLVGQLHHIPGRVVEASAEA